MMINISLYQLTLEKLSKEKCKVKKTMMMMLLRLTIPVMKK